MQNAPLNSCIALLGDYGFVLPADQINGTGEDFLAAIKAVSSSIIEEVRSTNHPKYYRPTEHRFDNLENILTRTLQANSQHAALAEDAPKPSGLLNNSGYSFIATTVPEFFLFIVFSYLLQFCLCK